MVAVRPDSMLRPGGENVVGGEGQAQPAFVIAGRGLDDADPAGIAVKARAGDDAAAVALSGEPLRDEPAVAQLRLLVRRPEIRDGLVKRVAAHAGVPVNAMRRAAGKKNRYGEGQEKLQREIRVHGKNLIRAGQSANGNQGT